MPFLERQRKFQEAEDNSNLSNLKIQEPKKFYRKKSKNEGINFYCKIDCLALKSQLATFRNFFSLELFVKDFSELHMFKTFYL